MSILIKPKKVQQNYNRRLSESKGATLDLSYDDRRHIHVINRLYVPWEWRREGIGKALMNEVCTHADEDQVVLALVPSPYGVEAMSKKQLMKFYVKFNFVLHPSGLMVRMPTFSIMGDN